MPEIDSREVKRPTCGTCPHFELFSSVAPDGTCRAHPLFVAPYHGGTYTSMRHPPTTATGWCGEHPALQPVACASCWGHGLLSDGKETKLCATCRGVGKVRPVVER